MSEKEEEKKTKRNSERIIKSIKPDSFDTFHVQGNYKKIIIMKKNSIIISSITSCGREKPLSSKQRYS